MTPVDPVVPEDPVVVVDPVLPVDPVAPEEHAPEVPIDPVRPVDPIAPTESSESGVPVRAAIPVHRPEIGAYLANQHAASVMFNHTLHDREGQLTFAKSYREDGSSIAAWTRIARDQFDGQSGEGLQTDTDLFQLGGEFANGTAGGSRFHIGGMIGTGRATTDTTSAVTGYRAKGVADGVSAGLYGTWFANAEDGAGFYVDGWLQYAKFNNRVSSDELARVSYDSHGWSGSIEAGYAMRVFASDRSELSIQPQAQLVYGDMKTDRLIGANGTTVSGDAGGLTTRAGARIYGNATDATLNRIQPFLELNWWHAGSDESVRLNTTDVSWGLPSDVYEAKVGLQMELGDFWSAWGNLGIRRAAGDYRDTSALVGLMRRW